MQRMCYPSCPSCGLRIGSRWQKYQQYLTQGATIEEALDNIRLRRYCCRRSMISPIVYPGEIDPEAEIRLLTSSKAVQAHQIAPRSAVLMREEDTRSILPSFKRTEDALGSLQSAAVTNLTDINPGEMAAELAGLEEPVVDEQSIAQTNIYGTASVEQRTLGITDDQHRGQTRRRVYM